MTGNVAQGGSEARHILVVGDDASARDGTAAYLDDCGYAVHTVGCGAAMDRVLSTAPIDLVVVDVRSPEPEGLAICRRFADGGPAVIVVSAIADAVDRVLGLELGADDYLTKPCNPRELLARVRAVLRRVDGARGHAPLRGGAYHFCGFALDAQRRQLMAPGGEAIVLTAAEHALLRAFVENPLRILSRDELLELSQGEQTDASARTVDVQVYRLRHKLHAWTDDEVIRTVRGAGYMFDVTVSRP